MDSNGAVGSGSRKAQKTHTKEKENFIFSRDESFLCGAGKLGEVLPRG
jgi:hypothetical protein